MIDTVKKAIRGQYALKRTKYALELDKQIKVYTGGLNAFGFSLDNPEHPPFAFFRDSPPKDLAKMCDAIVMLEYDNTLYIVLIEQKTGYSAQYDKQLANGKIFCEWLVSLCNSYGYVQTQNIAYYGALIWEPRPIPLRGGTTHSNAANAHPLFDKFFDIQNQTSIDVMQMIAS